MSTGVPPPPRRGRRGQGRGHSPGHGPPSPPRAESADPTPSTPFLTGGTAMMRACSSSSSHRPGNSCGTICRRPEPVGQTTVAGRGNLAPASGVLALHTAEVVADMLTETLIDWNINRKLSTITIDNCTTNDALIHLLLDKHPTNDMPLDGKVAVTLDPRYKMTLVDFSFAKFIMKVEGLRLVRNNSATKVPMISELDMCLEENLLPRARDFNILNWWKTNGVKFPTLQKMVKDSLAIPVSIVASEFAFSSSRRLINPHYSMVHHTTMEALMCSRVGCGMKCKVRKID
ncbi:UNVERIFIED_CONTAM: Zinc finger BED domain-containing protein RICESLEEPER 3 [Sesamum calycinum]|uniref:Zinc finger BED domain-containing protein RICESLEEPER 3 n=1 Tax=Sesamum calycinum TaxID=2727403 RepID=A0AAW2IUB3_9LAMI